MIIKNMAHMIIKQEREMKDKIVHNHYMHTHYPDKIRELLNISEGKRCFIIGNGPSLNKKDLEQLINEDCFACNRIYGIYKDVKWRPTFYCSQDLKVLEQIERDLPFAVKNCQKAFFPWNHRKLLNRLIDEYNVYSFYRPYVSVYSRDGTYPEGLIPFSTDISNKIYDGLSITYAMIQLAVYMGYKTIYLVGIDHNYIMKNGKVDAEQSYAEGIRSIDMSTQYPPELQLCEISFREAKRYCDSHGIHIYNATRGGKLEVFERIDFDRLF